MARFFANRVASLVGQVRWLLGRRNRRIIVARRLREIIG
jgi:hypothetical protein